jgi:hypothetical protein
VEICGNIRNYVKIWEIIEFFLSYLCPNELWNPLLHVLDLRCNWPELFYRLFGWTFLEIYIYYYIYLFFKFIYFKNFLFNWKIKNKFYWKIFISVLWSKCVLHELLYIIFNIFFNLTIWFNINAIGYLTTFKWFSACCSKRHFNFKPVILYLNI